MKKLIGWLTISASVVGALLGEITIGLPFFGVLLASGLLVTLND